MKASIQSLIAQFKNVVSEENEQEFRDKSKLKVILHFLGYRGSISVLEISF